MNTSWMRYRNRQILEATFPLKGGTKTHPVVVLSVDAVFRAEERYLCAMITSQPRIDDFSFPLKLKDISPTLSKSSCQVRTHIIRSFSEGELRAPVADQFLDEITFERLIDHIAMNVFGVEFLMEDPDE